MIVTDTVKAVTATVKKGCLNCYSIKVTVDARTACSAIGKNIITVIMS